MKLARQLHYTMGDQRFLSFQSTFRNPVFFLHGSSRSALRDMRGPSPGRGAGVSHLLCIPLPGGDLVLRDEDRSRRLIIRDSILFSRSALPVVVPFFFVNREGRQLVVLLGDPVPNLFPPKARSSDCG